MSVRGALVAVLVSFGALLGVSLCCGAPALAAEGWGVTGTLGGASSSPADPQPLSDPSDVAVNETSGDVYVTDKGNNRVEWFSSAGAYLGQFNGGGLLSNEKGKAAPEALSAPEGVAVDNDPASPSYGDVYVVDNSQSVVDKFSGAGEFLYQLGTSATGFAFPVVAVAVNSSGDVWASESEGLGRGFLWEFSDAVENALVSSVRPNRAGEDVGLGPGFAVDSEGNLYIASPVGFLAKLNEEGDVLAEENNCACTTGLAIEPSSNDLFVDQGSSIAQFGPFGEPYGEPAHVSGPHALAGATGIAVGSAGASVYVADPANNDVAVLTLGATSSATGTTDAPSEIRPTRATLNGEVDPAGAAFGAGFYFVYAPGSSCTGPGSSSTLFDNGGSNAIGPSGVGESVEVTGLSPATEYAYCIVAEHQFGGPGAGSSVTFTTASASEAFAPVIDSESFSGIASSDALLSALVTTENETSEYHFEYATNEALTGAASTATGSLPGSIVAQATGPVDIGGGLEPNTTYYYRAVASNALGAATSPSNGPVPVQSFLTLPDPPVVSTGDASAISPYTATIAGSVNPGSSGQSDAQKAQDDTTYWFQYSAGTSYATQAPLTPGDAGEGTSAKGEQVELSGLEPGTTYHYRILASNDNTNSEGGAPQLVYGQPETFTTVATPPTLGPASVGAITETGATVSGSVDAQGLPTHYELRLGTEPGGLRYAAAGDTSAAGSEALALTVGALTPGTLYYYELVALNPNSPAGGEGEREPTVSAVGSFTTLTAPVQAQGLLFAPVALLSVPPGAFASEASFVGTSTPKKLTNAQKLTAALRVCARKAKGKRAACERQARKRYGAKAKAKHSGKRR
jgi:hypothetical protein